MRKISKRYLLACLLLVSLFTMVFSMPVFAKNKALRYSLNYNGKYLPDELTDEQWANSTYDVSVFNSAKFKLNKTIELSGDVIIPAKMFRSKKSVMEIIPQFVINKTNAPDYDWLGGCAGRVFSVSGNGDKSVWNQYTEKTESTKNRLTVKKKNEYYIIHFTDKLTLSKAKFENDGGVFKPSSKKYYNLGWQIALHGNGIKKGYIYIDNVKVKTDNKTVKVTFDKKDYRNWGYYHNGYFVLDTAKAKIVNRPVS